MTNPVAVKGLRQLISELSAEVLPKPSRLRNLPPGKLESSGRLSVRGQYGFDGDGEFGFAGTATTEFPPSPPIQAKVQGGTQRRWESEGVGTMELDYSVVFAAHTQEESHE